MFYLTYDLGMYDDETICEEFDTVEELLERYEEIKWDVCEIEAWKDEKKDCAMVLKILGEFYI